jgi:hypothetical protein
MLCKKAESGSFLINYPIFKMHYTSRYYPKRFSFGNSYYQKVKLTCVFTKSDKHPRRVVKKLLKDLNWLGSGYYFVSASYYSRKDAFPMGIYGWMLMEDVVNNVFDHFHGHDFCNSILTLSFSFTDHPISQQLLGVEKRRYGQEHHKSEKCALIKKGYMLRILDRFRSMGFSTCYV